MYLPSEFSYKVIQQNECPRTLLSHFNLEKMINHMEFYDHNNFCGHCANEYTTNFPETSFSNIALPYFNCSVNLRGNS